MDRTEKAVELFKSGFACSQAVLAAYSDLFGLDEKTALKIAGGFGGGIGGTADICGALSGAIMAIGLKYSPVTPLDKEQKNYNYMIVKKFLEEFKKQTNVIKCKDLLNYDISIEEEKQKAKENKLFDTICPECVRLSCLILEDILFNEYKNI
jgi:C_GCAxxG_C_C family probable redox protein